VGQLAVTKPNLTLKGKNNELCPGGDLLGLTDQIWNKLGRAHGVAPSGGMVLLTCLRQLCVMHAHCAAAPARAQNSQVLFSESTHGSKHYSELLVRGQNVSGLNVLGQKALADKTYSQTKGIGIEIQNSCFKRHLNGQSHEARGTEICLAGQERY
jgi:hypothetical protein